MTLTGLQLGFRNGMWRLIQTVQVSFSLVVCVARSCLRLFFNYLPFWRPSLTALSKLFMLATAMMVMIDNGFGARRRRWVGDERSMAAGSLRHGDGCAAVYGGSRWAGHASDSWAGRPMVYRSIRGRAGWRRSLAGGIPGHVFFRAS